MQHVQTNHFCSINFRVHGIYSHCLEHGMGYWLLLSVCLVGGNAAYMFQAISAAFNFTHRLVRMNWFQWKHQDTEGNRPFERMNAISSSALQLESGKPVELRRGSAGIVLASLRTRVSVTHGPARQFPSSTVRGKEGWAAASGTATNNGHARQACNLGHCSLCLSLIKIFSKISTK
jgi:hypothetical protein